MEVISAQPRIMDATLGKLKNHNIKVHYVKWGVNAVISSSVASKASPDIISPGQYKINKIREQEVKGEKTKSLGEKETEEKETGNEKEKEKEKGREKSTSEPFTPTPRSTILINTPILYLEHKGQLPTIRHQSSDATSPHLILCKAVREQSRSNQSPDIKHVAHPCTHYFDPAGCICPSNRREIPL